jgi:Protein of unknown function (DUF2795)
MTVSHQQTDKHGSAIDEELKNPRRQVSAGTRHRDRAEDSPIAPTAAEPVRLRSELARFLGPAAFPGTAHDLLATARDNHATNEIQRLLQQVPDRIYRTVEEVFETIHGPMDL